MTTGCDHPRVFDGAHNGSMMRLFLTTIGVGMTLLRERSVDACSTQHVLYPRKLARLPHSEI